MSQYVCNGHVRPATSWCVTSLLSSQAPSSPPRSRLLADMLAALLCASSVAFSPVALTSRSAVVQTRTEPVMLESAALGRRSAFLALAALPFAAHADSIEVRTRQNSARARELRTVPIA